MCTFMILFLFYCGSVMLGSGVVLSGSVITRANKRGKELQTAGDCPIQHVPQTYKRHVRESTVYENKCSESEKLGVIIPIGQTRLKNRAILSHLRAQMTKSTHQLNAGSISTRHIMWACAYENTCIAKAPTYELYSRKINSKIVSMFEKLYSKSSVPVTMSTSVISVTSVSDHDRMESTRRDPEDIKKQAIIKDFREHLASIVRESKALASTSSKNKERCIKKNCKSNTGKCEPNISYKTKQTKGSDEAMVIKFTCNICGHTW